MEPAKDMRFLSKALEQRRRGQHGPKDLEGDRAARVVLLRLVHRAHAPLAEHTHDPVAGDGWRERWGWRGQLLSRALQRAAQEQLSYPRLLVEFHEFLDGRAQVRVAGALLVQEGRLLDRVQIDHLVKQLLNALEGRFGHRRVPRTRRAQRSRFSSQALM